MCGARGAPAPTQALPQAAAARVFRELRHSTAAMLMASHPEYPVEILWFNRMAGRL